MTTAGSDLTTGSLAGTDGEEAGGVPAGGRAAAGSFELGVGAGPQPETSQQMASVMAIHGSRLDMLIPLGDIVSVVSS